jgi:predicted nucleotidyltransferase
MSAPCEALHEFVTACRTALGADFRRAILFGSRARGDERPDSDYDVAVIVAEEADIPLARERASGLAFDFFRRRRLDVAPLVLRGSKLSGPSELARRIAADGIPLP